MLSQKQQKEIKKFEVLTGIKTNIKASEFKDFKYLSRKKSYCEILENNDSINGEKLLCIKDVILWYNIDYDTFDCDSFINECGGIENIKNIFNLYNDELYQLVR